jgi:hypothetical protein
MYANNTNRLLALIPFVFGLLLARTASGDDTPDARVSCVVKLNNWAVILPKLESVAARWQPDVELWNPSLAQVIAADKRVLKRIQDESRRGINIDPRGKYIIQYYGISLKGCKRIVCVGWEMNALLKVFQQEYGAVTFERMLTELIQSEFLVRVEDNGNGPVSNLELQYDPIKDQFDDDEAGGRINSESHHSTESSKAAAPTQTTERLKYTVRRLRRIRQYN